MNKSELERQHEREQQAPSKAHPHLQLPVQPLSRHRLSESNGYSFELPQALRVAMGSLEVDLNEELARYRQHVEAHPMTSPKASLESIDGEGICEHEQVSLAIAPSSSTNVLAEVDKAIEAVSSSALVPSDILPNDDLRAIALHTQAPDSYLESSEALLRSLDELDEDKPLPSDDLGSTPSTSNLWASIMTPLGIGSLMLLVLSTATLGYVVVHPAILGFGDNDASLQEDDIAADDAPASSRSGIFADLASSEFDELDLNSLSITSRQQQTSPFSDFPSSIDNDALGVDDGNIANGGDVRSAQTAPLIPSQVQPVMPQRFATSAPASTSTQSSAETSTSAPTSITQSSTPQSSRAQSSASSTTEMTPTPSSTAANPSESQSAATDGTERPQDGFVYVVAPFTGDRSLEQAQQAVPGAHLRNFPQGAQVQLGAFSTPERAQRLVQELNSQGIPAQVYSR